MEKLTSEELFKYTVSFFELHKRWPKVTEAAKCFGVKANDIEGAASGWDGEGYMGIIVGFGTALGAYAILPKRDRLVEAYDGARPRVQP